MFSVPQGSSYIDITVVGQNVLGMVESWSIPDYDSLSDHRMISFELKIPGIDRASDCFVTTNVFNSKKANWNMFYSYCTTVENQILDLLESCTQSNSLEECAYNLQELIISAAEKSTPLKKNSFYKLPWWSFEIFCMRKQLNAARRRYQRTKNFV